MTTSSTWYQDAVIYQLHVRSFCDSDGDGVGDFVGLLEKLDYIQDLGVSAIWLMPFYPSPLRDDGYDIADYLSINPQYGTMEAFQAFLNAAHQRGLKVITELVLNHTSDQHPWFQRARRSPSGSSERDFYVWSDHPDRYPEVRVIFNDFEPSNWTYDREAKAYFWHRFYSHQPDLNFDNPAVREAIWPVIDFWFGMGVDGMRLDAVPYLFERDGTSCESLPETHAYLKSIRRYIDERYPNRMLLAEANQWPEDAVAYFGAGDECHMAFHFPVMPRLFMGINREDRFPIVDIIEQTPAIPTSCQWATFLRNHDELTLEMVTDEERDYMYRVYAAELRARLNFGIRRRLSPLLENNRRRIELMNGLLFSLPGTPVVYYGDEIGMGDNIYLGDRNGVRTPMQWSSDRNAGFSRANPQKLFLPVVIDPEYNYETVNVEAQQSNSHSLLWWMKRLIDTRRRYPALGRGAIQFLHPANRKVLAFLRQHADETVLVVANLSRFVQHVELPLESFEGRLPIEIFGGTHLPRVAAGLYPLTLGPNSFYWIRLAALLPEQAGAELPLERLPSLRIRRSWREFLHDDRHELRFALSDYLARQLHHPPQGTSLRPLALEELGRLSVGEGDVSLALLRVDSSSEEIKTYLTPLKLVEGARAEEVLQQHAQGVVASIVSPNSSVLIDASLDPELATKVIHLICRAARVAIAPDRWLTGRLVGATPTAETTETAPPVMLIKQEGRSTTLSIGQQHVLKILREVSPGAHPAVELGLYLARSGRACPVVPVQGYLELQSPIGETQTVAILYEYSRHEDTAWQFSLDALSDFYEQSVAAGFPDGAETVDLDNLSLCDRALEQFRPWATQLGECVADLHAALAGDRSHPEFLPEPSLPPHTRSMYQSLRGNAISALEELRQQLPKLPPEWHAEARALIEQREAILRFFRRIVDERIDTVRIRCHGDLQLSRLLYTGKGFLAIDFSGDPRAPLSERRIKRRPLRDVAALLHSLNYASRVALSGLASGRGQAPGTIREADRSRAAAWSRAWSNRMQAVVLSAYEARLATAGCSWSSGARELPLLYAFRIDRALFDVVEELRHRLEWVGVAVDCALDAIADAVDDVTTGTANPLAAI
jgi:maltose alpha-D-glucosyltransferase/alpha-amylase